MKGLIYILLLLIFSSCAKEEICNYQIKYEVISESNIHKIINYDIGHIPIIQDTCCYLFKTKSNCTHYVNLNIWADSNSIIMCNIFMNDKVIYNKSSKGFLQIIKSFKLNEL